MDDDRNGKGRRFGRRQQDKLFWFPFEINEWETDRPVKLMGPAARGIFLTLLIEQWREGSIPSNVLVLLRLLNMPADPVRTMTNLENKDGWQVDIEACLEQVLELFEPDGNGGLINRKLERLRTQQDAMRAERSRAGRKSAAKRQQTSNKSATKLTQILNTVPTEVPTKSNELELEKESEIEKESKSKSLGESRIQDQHLELIYNSYPRKVGKGDALKSIRKALERLAISEAPLPMPSVGERAEWLQNRTAAYARSPDGQKGEYTPHPATWFNQSRYLDDESEWYRNGQQQELSKKQQRTINNQTLLARELLGIDVDQDARFGAEVDRVRDGVRGNKYLVEGVPPRNTEGD